MYMSSRKICLILVVFLLPDKLGLGIPHVHAFSCRPQNDSSIIPLTAWMWASSCNNPQNDVSSPSVYKVWILTTDDWPRGTLAHFGNFQMTINLQRVIQLAPFPTTSHPTHSVFGSGIGFGGMADGTLHFRLDQVQDGSRVMAVWIMVSLYMPSVDALLRYGHLKFFSKWPPAAILDWSNRKLRCSIRHHRKPQLDKIQHGGREPFWNKTSTDNIWATRQHSLYTQTMLCPRIL